MLLYVLKSQKRPKGIFLVRSNSWHFGAVGHPIRLSNDLYIRRDDFVRLNDTTLLMSLSTIA